MKIYTSPSHLWSIFLIIFLTSFAEGKSEEPIIPLSVITASKFIKEFHKKLEDDSYPAIKTEMNDPDINSSLQAAIAEFAEKNDKNFSSFIKCSNKTVGSLTVEIVNSTRLSALLLPDPNITSRLTEGPCVALMFFSPSCPFSCLAAPHFNVLPRAFPNIKMVAINAIQHQAFNTQFGIAGVPTVMLFHNGRPAAKFNDTEYTLELFVRFFFIVAGVRAEKKMFVSSSDIGGPVPTVRVRETDFVLGLAWAVILAAFGYGLTRLRRWQVFVESVAAVWREANHDHTD